MARASGSHSLPDESLASRQSGTHYRLRRPDSASSTPTAGTRRFARPRRRTQVRPHDVLISYGLEALVLNNFIALSFRPHLAQAFRELNGSPMPHVVSRTGFLASVPPLRTVSRARKSLTENGFTPQPYDANLGQRAAERVAGAPSARWPRQLGATGSNAASLARLEPMSGYGVVELLQSASPRLAIALVSPRATYCRGTANYKGVRKGCLIPRVITDPARRACCDAVRCISRTDRN